MNTEMNTAQKPIRTNLLQLIKANGMSVREFRSYAERTRLRTENNLIKAQMHIQLWKNYNWIS